MTDEIKEIELDHFNNINELKQNVETWIKEDDMYWNRWFSLYDLKTLLDYITNLQQDLEKANGIIEKDRQFYKCRMDEYVDYKSKCEKAIKDIDLLMTGNYEVCGTIYMQSSCCNKRLEIIKKDLIGSDENE